MRCSVPGMPKRLSTVKQDSTTLPGGVSSANGLMLLSALIFFTAHSPNSSAIQRSDDSQAHRIFGFDVERTGVGDQ